MDSTPKEAVIGTPEYEAQAKAGLERMKERRSKPKPPPTKSAIDLWANFLFNEKLDPKSLVDEKNVLVLVNLCAKLAETGTPYEGVKAYPMHTDKIAARRKVCTTAFDLAIDMTKLKKRKHGGRGTKVAMGRGLLDVWNEEYAKRFGGTLGTPGAAEVIRRKVVTKLSTELKDEDRPGN